MSAARSKRARDAGIPLVEWIVAGVGFVLVASTLAFLGYRAFAGDGSPPDVSVRVQSVVEISGGYLVQIAARNVGDRTAANVKVEGALKSGANVVETSEMTFTYLPPRSQRTGGLFFKVDPRRHELSLDARGYEDP